MSKRGENIFKRKDGRWEARYIHHYENGKAVYRYLYGKTYTEVKAKRQAELSLPENSKKSVIKSQVIFDELAALWLSDIKCTVKESTYTRYFRTVKKYLSPYFQKKSVIKTDKEYLRSFTDYLLAGGGANGDPLSAKTVSDILCVLKAILKYGEENNYPVPSTDCIKYPQKSSKKITILPDEQRIKTEQILFHSEDTVCLGILFTLYTGVRIGELCGLRWEDINFSEETVKVCRTVERIADLNPFSNQKTKVIISEPKTENSIRTIPLPSCLIEYLRNKRCADSCYILTGNRYFTEPHQYYVRYRKFLERNEINTYTFHALRHTFATRCVELGFDTKSLAEILGHSNVTTTLSFYVHPTLQQKKNQMERLVPAAL